MASTTEKIRELIKESGLTQAKFAQSVGLHPVTLSRFLTSGNLSPKALQKIASKTGITLTDLMPDDEIGNLADESEASETSKANPYIIV